jgi:hypothetical protein
LTLKDLAQLVRCSRRFRHVARKERSRGLRTAPVIRTIPLFACDSLNHHISSVRLSKRDASDTHITCFTLHQLRSLPQLTKLSMRVEDINAAVALLPGWPSTVAAATEQLIAALPTSLRSFSFRIRSSVYRNPRCAQFETLGVAILAAAAATMPQLTELSIHHESSWDDVQLDALVALPLLRKLTITGSFARTSLCRLKQLSQLRVLHLDCLRPEGLMSMCQPPHLLQLEELVADVELDEAEMRALLHLPTLTRLEPSFCFPDAWPRLSQFPHLRRLYFSTHVDLTAAELTAFLSAALARCAVLEDLTLLFNLSRITSEDACAQRTCWSILLPSLSNIRRLTVGSFIFLAPFIDVLPEHLPRLEQLTLSGWQSGVLAQLAHPTLQQLKLTENEFETMPEEQVQSLLHSSRLPQLRSCTNATY